MDPAMPSANWAAESKSYPFLFSNGALRLGLPELLCQENSFRETAIKAVLVAARTMMGKA